VAGLGGHEGLADCGFCFSGGNCELAIPVFLTLLALLMIVYLFFFIDGVLKTTHTKYIRLP
jgi:hypothetical protein